MPVDAFRLAAIVLFVLAGVFFLFVDTITLKTDLGLQAFGLAAWCASSVAWRP